MLGRKGISDARLAAVLRQCGGLVTLTAIEIGTSEQNVRQRIKRSPKLAAAVAEIRDLLLDVAESTVITGMRAGDLPTARWYLDRQGKARGYDRPNPKLTIEGGGVAEPVMVVISGPDNEF